MSLEDEMLILNDQYQATMQENEELKERINSLEKLVSEYMILARGALIAVSLQKTVQWNFHRDALEQRAKAALFEGKYDKTLQQE